MKASGRQNVKRLAVDAVLVALALALSIAEHWIPLELVLPIPGIKLGLANIVTLFALMRLTPRDAAAVLLVRCLVMGAVFGMVYLLFSLSGGLLALLVMWLLRPLEGKVFSVVGISVAGAAAHNIGQIFMAALILKEPLLLMTYLPPLLLTGIAAGALTGIAVTPVIRFWKGRLTAQPEAPKSGMKPPGVGLVLLIFMTVMLLPLSGCRAQPTEGTTAGSGLNKYSYEFVGTFGTAIQIIGYAKDEASFSKHTEAAEKRFRELHELFDPYHDYPGINNLKTINDKAGVEPVQVSPEIIDIIMKSIEWNRTISDKTNIALGRTIQLWKTFREQAIAEPDKAAVPDGVAIAESLAHADIGCIKIDETAGTVFLTDPDMWLDLGAVGKGCATEIVARELAEMGATAMIINAGYSNIRLIGSPADGRETWSVGLLDPRALLSDEPAKSGDPAETGSVTTGETAADDPRLAAIFHINDLSVVTSGDYQQYYQVDGEVFHHLIDPADGMPARYCRSVTVITGDSGFADFLSTALFLLPYDESRKLAESLTGIEVLWIFRGGRIEMTEGLKEMTEVDP